MVVDSAQGECHATSWWEVVATILSIVSYIHGIITGSIKELTAARKHIDGDRRLCEYCKARILLPGVKYRLTEQSCTRIWDALVDLLHSIDKAYIQCHGPYLAVQGDAGVPSITRLTSQSASCKLPSYIFLQTSGTTIGGDVEVFRYMGMGKQLIDQVDVYYF